MKTITNYGTRLAPNIYSYLIQPHEKRKKKCFLHCQKRTVILKNAEAYNNAMTNWALFASSHCVSHSVLFDVICQRSFVVDVLSLHVYFECFVRRKFPSTAATAKQVVCNQAFFIISIKQITRITPSHLLEFFLMKHWDNESMEVCAKLSTRSNDTCSKAKVFILRVYPSKGRKVK